MVATVTYNAAKNGCLIDVNVTHNTGPVFQVHTKFWVQNKIPAKSLPPLPNKENITYNSSFIAKVWLGGCVMQIFLLPQYNRVQDVEPVLW